MAINFPDSPAPGTNHTVDGKTWTFTDGKWALNVDSLGVVGPTGPSGPQGVSGVSGVSGISGVSGASGVSGIGFTFRGAYDGGAQYYVNHVVTYGGSSWICIQTIDGVAPAENTWWTVFAEHGASGVSGVSGVIGATGPSGPSGPVGNLNSHESVHVATTAALNNGAAYTVGSADGNGGHGIGAYLQATTFGALTIDSHAVGVGDRVLVKNQTNQIHNGIYVVTTVGNGSTYWRLTRSSDFDNSTGPEASNGDYAFVSQGTTNSGTSWMMNSYGTNVDESIIIGTDAMNWVNVGGAGPVGPTGPTGAGGTVAYFGGFYSDTTQSIVTNLTPQVVTFSGSYPTPFGISTNGQRITFAHAGTYMFNFVVQVANLSNDIQTAQFWIRYNGTDWADSNTQSQLKARKNPGVPSEQLATMSMVGTAANDGDYIELWWYATSTDVSILATPASTTPVAPTTPSVIATITQVTYTQVGPSGISGISGVPGISGISGVPGISGISGVPGTWATTQTVNPQSGTSYPLVSGDVGKMITLSNASQVTVTVGTSLGMTAGQSIDILSLTSTSNLSKPVLVSAGGATLVGTPGLYLRTQYSAGTLFCIGTNSFVLIGDLSA